jgi:Bacterial toxin homologue of phage lysozyme, C-term
MSDTLSADIDHVRVSGSAIDIPEDLEDQAIKHWLRHSAAFNLGGKSYVIGDGVLPQRWQPLSKVFKSENEAQVLLRHAFHGHLPGQLRNLAVIRDAGTFPRDEVANVLARALFTRKAWVIPKRAMPPIEKASAAIFTAVNGACGTRVNFEYLAKWEGGQVLHGYVPCQNGIVAGRSGLSIATGFDMGQLSAGQLEILGFPDDLYKLFLPFTNHRFTKMSHARAAKAVAAIGAPVPVINKSQADEVDRIVHLDHLKAAILAWDRDRKPGIPTFAMLPIAWQTVLFSRTFHMGKGMSRSKTARKFYSAATSGDWKMATEELRNFPVAAAWYKLRVSEEANYLQTAT